MWRNRILDTLFLSTAQLKAAREEKEKLESAGSGVPTPAAAVPTSTSTSEAVPGTTLS